MAAPFVQQDAGAVASATSRPSVGDAPFPQLPRLATPLKRSRTEEAVTERISDDLARTSVDTLGEAAEMDNLRSQKRFLSESMAADMSKMSCGGGLSLGGRPGSGRLSADSSCARAAPEASVSDEGPGSPMATDRRGSGGSAGSPQASECFNPFVASVPARTARLSGGAGESVTSLRRTSATGSIRDSDDSAGSAAMLLSPTTPQRGGPIASTTGFATPSPARTRMSRGACCTAMDASEAERLPPSPSDPALGQDLRRTALLRSLLQRTEEKAPAATPLHARHKPVGELTAFAAEQQRRQQKLAADMAASHAAHQQQQQQQNQQQQQQQQQHRGSMGPPAPPASSAGQPQGGGGGGRPETLSPAPGNLLAAAPGAAIPPGRQQAAGNSPVRQPPAAAPLLMHSPTDVSAMWAPRRPGINPFGKSAPAAGLLGTSPSYGSASMEFSAMEDDDDSSSDSGGEGWPMNGRRTIRDLGRSMSVSSAPSNGAGGVFAFEDEPLAASVVSRPAAALSAADAAHRRHAEALGGSAGGGILPQQQQQQQQQQAPQQQPPLPGLARR